MGFLWTGVRFHGGQGEKKHEPPGDHYFEILDADGKVLVKSRVFDNAFETKRGFVETANRVMDILVPDPLAPPEIEGTQP